MDALLQDLRFAARSLRSTPGFTVGAALTLALGIAATTAVFAVADGVLLRPLPYPEPDRLVALWETRPDDPSRPVAPANFLDWRRQSESFASLSGYRVMSANLLAPGDPERLAVASVSGDFFATLGVSARVGRTFTATDSARRGDRGAVLSESLWRRRFGADPEVAGTVIRLDSETVVVLGVAPAWLALPAEADLWVHAPGDVPEIRGMAVGDVAAMRDSWYFGVVGRLRSGVSLQRARTDMDRVAAALQREHPDSNRDAGIRLLPLRQEVVGNAGESLGLLLAAVGFLLLISCTNVAGLMLARAGRRRRELATRAAIGADPGRLLRQSLLESSLLAGAGGLVGVLLAYPGTAGLLRLLPADTPRLQAVGVDLRIVAFAAVAAGLTGLLFGSIPALTASRGEPAAALRTAGRSVAGSGLGARKALLVGQLGLTLALILGAGLMLRTVDALGRVDPGLDPERVLSLRVNLPAADELEHAERVILYDAMLEKIGGLAGVEAVSGALLRPLRLGPAAGLRVQSAPRPDNELPDVFWNVVGVDYFRTLGIPLRAGRTLTAQDDAGGTLVAVVNETLARRIFGDRDPIGERIRTGLDGDSWVTIVGVVGDTRNRGPAAATEPMMFRPLAQPTRFGVDHLRVVLRGVGDPLQLVRPARRAVWSVRSDAPVDEVRTLRDVLHGAAGEPRTLARLLSVFGVLALFQGAVGTFGVVASLVSSRRRELALRVALGSTPNGVVRLVSRHTLWLAAGGLGLGLAAAAIGQRLIRGLLFGVAATDPLVLTSVVGLLLAVALLSGWIPARRAARLQPMSELQAD